MYNTCYYCYTKVQLLTVLSIASASWDRTIKIWQVNTGREIATLTGHENYVRAIAFSPDEETLVSVSDDDTIKIWQPI
ncbi:MAG: hypothetical protein HRU34_22350 [Richelia sp.]|nr:hypothetical protein [Richelia sp.]